MSDERMCGVKTLRGRSRRSIALLVVVIAACGARTARAIDRPKPPPLTGRVVCVSTRARTSGPLAVTVHLNWRGKGLLEGRLRIDIVEGPEVRCTYERPDVTLTNGPQGIRLVLPSPRAGAYNSQLEARITFISEKRTYNLPSSTIFVPRASDRGVVVAVTEPRGRPGLETRELFRALRLEQFDPERRTGKTNAAAVGGKRTLVTTPAYPTPGDMPSTGAAYCAFDVVVLAGDGFSLVRQRQLDAVLTWVRAGGSVLVLPVAGMKAYHVGFLNALSGIGTDAASSTYRLTPGGRVEGKAGLRHFYTGIGRAVVGLEVPRDEEALEDKSWRRATAFLWKVRNSHIDNIARNGEWAAVEEDTTNEDWRYQDYRYRRQDGRFRFGRVPISAGDTINRKLFPERIKVVPLWVIIVILALFVAVIGPLDYFVLGLLKRRKLTWITFPAAAVGFALFTMILAEVYMGSSDHRNSVTIIDLGQGGRILRSSRYEVIVAGRNRISKTEVVGGFFSPIDPAALPGRRDRYSTGSWGAPHYEGLLPARFTVTQQLNQWEPRMNRFLYIGAEAPALKRQSSGQPPRVKLDWDAIGLKSFEDREPGRIWSTIVESDPRNEVEIVTYHGRQGKPRRGNSDGLPSETLRELCVRPQRGFFTIVSQISPTGGGDFEDSAVLDPTDPDQWLLVVVVRDGQNVTMYRRLFHKGAVGER